MLDQVPRLDIADAERLARALYGLDARATPLPSERDQNFLLETADGTRLVLKVANAGEERAMLAAQQEALAHLAGVVDAMPRVLPTLSGDRLGETDGPGGARHLVWAVTHRPGVMLAKARRRSTALLEDFGRRAGELGRGLATFAIRRSTGRSTGTSRAPATWWPSTARSSATTPWAPRWTRSPSGSTATSRRSCRRCGGARCTAT